MSKNQGKIIEALKPLKGKRSSLTLKEYAEQHGFTRTGVWVVAQRFNVSFKPGVRGQKALITFNGHKMSQIKLNRIMEFKAQLPQLDERERLNADDIAARLGLSNTTIRAWCHILRHRLHNHNGRVVYKHDTTGWPAIIDPMLKRGEPMKVIMAAIHGVSSCSIYRWLANTERITVRERDRSTYKSACPN
jgi:hypothetical protein